MHFGRMLWPIMVNNIQVVVVNTQDVQPGPSTVYMSIKFTLAWVEELLRAFDKQTDGDSPFVWCFHRSRSRRQTTLQGVAVPSLVVSACSLAELAGSTRFL